MNWREFGGVRAERSALSACYQSTDSAVANDPLDAISDSIL